MSRSSSPSSSSSFTTADPDAEYTVSLLEKKASDSEFHETPTRWGSKSQTSRRWRDSPYLVPAVVVLAITNMAMIIAVVILLRSQPQTSFPLNHPPQGPAKALRGLVQPPQPTRLMQPFWHEDGNVLKQHASDEADEAWDEYTLDSKFRLECLQARCCSLTQASDAILFYISKEDAAQADIDPKRHAYVDNPAEGQVGYVAALEVTHQMHCLDMLRKSLYYNIKHTRARCEGDMCPDSPKYKDREEFELYIQNHIDHCVELLRQRLACTSDLGLVPFMWVGTQGRLYPDTNRMHTCNNYDAVHRWGKENLVDFPTPGGAVRPKKGEFYLKDYI